MTRSFNSHIFPESDRASQYCFHEKPDGKLVSSCNFISSHSIWFINLTNSLKKKKKKGPAPVCQISCLARGRLWVHTMSFPSSNSSSLLASILCQRLKIASGLLQNKQFMDSGFDAAFAWRGQLSPACRKTGPHH